MMSSALTAKAMSSQKTVVSGISAISTKYTALRDLGRHLLVLVSRTDRLALERLDRPQPAVEAVSHELCRTYGVESVLTVHGGPARRGTAHGSAPSIWKIHAKPRNPSKNRHLSCRTACLPCAYLQARDGNPCPIHTRARTDPPLTAEEVDRDAAPSAQATAGAFQAPDCRAYSATPLAKTVCIRHQPAVEAVCSSRHRPHAFGDQRTRATAPPGREPPWMPAGRTRDSTSGPGTPPPGPRSADRPTNRRQASHR